MPRRGERIGDAYVRIHADGSGIERDIRSDLDDLGDAFKEFGDDHAEAYNESFRKENRKQRKVTNKEIVKGFDEALGQMAARIERLTPALQKDIRKQFRKIFSDPVLADIAADNLIKDIADGFRDIGKDDLFVDLRAQMRRTNRDWEATLDEALRMNADFNRDRLRMEQEINRAISADRDKAFELQIATIGRLRGEMTDLQEEVDRLVKGNAKWGESTRDVNERLRALRTQLADVTDLDEDTTRTFAQMRLSLIRLSPAIQSVNRRWDGMADRVGRLTGRGSRNNFLNFIGSVNRNLTRLFGSIVFGTARGITGFTRLARALPEFIADPSLFKEALKNSASFFANLAANAVALAVGLAALAAGAGILVTALAGLAAILTSLVATVAFAAASAIPALVGALLPLVAVAGVAAAAILSLSDAQKEALSNDLKPLTDAFKGLGDAAADILIRDVGEWARDLAPVIRSLKPGVEGVARAIRDTLGRAIDDAADNPKFANFVERFNTFLPNAVRKLGTVLTNVFEAFGGILLAMLPSINRFLRWLVDITDEFSEWANSRAGRREIREFFEKAGDSAAALGDFLGEVIALVSELLDQSRATGDNLFRDMADAVEDMVDFLRSPEGKKAIEDWLEFGEDLAGALGDAIVAAADLWDELDNPTNRAFLLLLVDTLADVLDFITAAHDEAQQFGEALAKAVADLREALSGLGNLSLRGLFTSPLSSLETLFTTLRRFTRALSRLPVVGNLFAPLADGVRMVDELVDKVAGAIRKLPSPPALFADLLRAGENLRNLVDNAIRNAITRLPNVKNLFANVIGFALGFLALLGRIPELIRGLPSVGDIFSGALSAAATLLNLLANIARILLTPFTLKINVDIPDPGGGIPFVDGLASGGLFGRVTNGPLLRWVGEDGPEAIVPLNRRLSDVDPSVRGLSAIAQGLATPSGRTINIPEINVTLAEADPMAVAQALLNRVVATGY